MLNDFSKHMKKLDQQTELQLAVVLALREHTKTLYLKSFSFNEAIEQ